MANLKLYIGKKQKMIKKLLKKTPATDFSSVDNAPEEIIKKRKDFIESISSPFELLADIPDVEFNNYHRVPFPFADFIAEKVPPNNIVNNETDTFYSYGVDIFGDEKIYHDFIQQALNDTKDFTLKLGKYHPVVKDNVDRLKAISGLEQVTFHMSGTEAVQAAIRVARFNTGKKTVIRYGKGYHGWIDIDNCVDIKHAGEAYLTVDAACVIVNPLTALYRKGVSKSDALLFASANGNTFSKTWFTKELNCLREYCDEHNIPLIIDDVFLGFRLAYGGSQEYFGVEADIVTYGKTLGGGLPVGVVCGKARWLKKFDEKHPLRFLASRGTFANHPVVMLSMNNFLKHLDPTIYADSSRIWDNRINQLNKQLQDFPLYFDNMQTIVTTHYTDNSRYNWMLQFYLQQEGLILGPYGTGRFIFPITLGDKYWLNVEGKIISAVQNMHKDGWWYVEPNIKKKKIFWRLVKQNIKLYFTRRNH